MSVNFSVATILEFLMRDDCRTAGVLFGNLSDGYEPAVVRLLGNVPRPSFGSKAHYRYRHRIGDGRLIFCVPIHGSRRGNTSIDVITASFPFIH